MNKKILLIILITLLATTFGCVDSGTGNSTDSTTIKLMKSETIDNVEFSVFHDNEYNVTCWHMNSLSIGEGGNCIPDSELNKGN